MGKRVRAGWPVSGCGPRVFAPDAREHRVPNMACQERSPLCRKKLGVPRNGNEQRVKTLAHPPRTLRKRRCRKVSRGTNEPSGQPAGGSRKKQSRPGGGLGAPPREKRKQGVRNSARRRSCDRGRRVSRNRLRSSDFLLHKRNGPPGETGRSEEVAGATRLELATSGLTGRRSNQTELRPRAQTPNLVTGLGRGKAIEAHFCGRSESPSRSTRSRAQRASLHPRRPRTSSTSTPS